MGQGPCALQLGGRPGGGGGDEIIRGRWHHLQTMCVCRTVEGHFRNAVYNLSLSTLGVHHVSFRGWRGIAGETQLDSGEKSGQRTATARQPPSKHTEKRPQLDRRGAESGYS